MVEPLAGTTGEVMKRLIIIAALALTGGAAASAPSTCQAGKCLGIPPICLAPDHPVCICSGISITSCRWICGH
jgi:hypothetical protein